MRRRPPLLVIGALVLVSAACSTVDPLVPSASPPPAATLAPSPTSRTSTGVVVIEAAEQYFNPDQITVKVGTTVVWNDVQGTHDMVADDKSFASAVLFEGGTYAHLFAAPGHYRYICTLHVGAGMWAEVNVQ